MTESAPGGAIVRPTPALDDETRLLVRLAGVVAASDEQVVRRVLSEAAGRVRPEWVEEVLLQSYLFAGFPRALNAMREWRRVSGRAAPDADDGERIADITEWSSRGETTCAVVYGPFYDRLRVNIRDLHPALDSWMIVDGYGKVLSRPGLDLARRELCIVAACALARQDRQLHSHLYGALHAGASNDAVSEALEAVSDLLAEDDRRGARLLWSRVRQSLVGRAGRAAGTAPVAI